MQYNSNYVLFHTLRILKLFARHKIFIYVFQLTDQFEFYFSMYWTDSSHVMIILF